MTTIYLIRHAEAYGNVFGRAQGQYNSYLTPFGLSQLPLLAKRFEKIDIDMVFASDYKRAFMTAKSIVDIKNLSVIKNEKFREMHMGDVEDISWGDFPHKFADLSNLWYSDPKNCLFPNGESPEIVGNRVYDEIIKITKENRGKNIVIGTHGAAIRFFLYKIKNIDLKDTSALDWSFNTSVTKLIIDDNNQITIEIFNDASHLDGLKAPFSMEKWWKNADEKTRLGGTNFWFRPVNLDTEFEQLCEFMVDFYESAYGSFENFDSDEFLLECKKAQEIMPESVSFAMISDEICGLARIDVEISTGNIGYIGNIAVKPKYRGGSFAPQIIGEFAHLYRNLGKDTLRARVSKKNARAIRFYEKLGFINSGEMTNENGDHFLMDLNISLAPM